MPALAHDTVAAEERYEWLGNYIQTYFERDVRDLANLRKFEPFVRAQQALSATTGCLLNLAVGLIVRWRSPSRYRSDQEN